jgi:hypothetical protein
MAAKRRGSSPGRALRARGVHSVSSSGESTASVVCNHSATAMHRYRREQRGLGRGADWAGATGVAPSARGSPWRGCALTPNNRSFTCVKQTGVELVPGWRVGALDLRRAPAPRSWNPLGIWLWRSSRPCPAWRRCSSSAYETPHVDLHRDSRLPRRALHRRQSASNCLAPLL